MTLCPPRLALLAFLLILISHSGRTQRTYAGHSVLASGNWYKIGVSQPGIYKIDLAFLGRMGVNTSNLASSSLKLYGNGGKMLPESNKTPRPDDLVENAIWIEDGGDGILNGSDYLLFYANGPDAWIADTAQRSFNYQKNLFSSQAYYFLAIGSNGKRIETQPGSPVSNITVTTFNGRYHYEKDSFNFLSSGKQWFGEEFSNLPGQSLSKSFTVSLPNLSAQPARIIVSAIARSFGTSSRLGVNIAGQGVMDLDIPPVANSSLDLFAQTRQQLATFNASAGTVPVQFNYSQGSFGSQAWLDWFEIHSRNNLDMAGLDQLLFRDWNSVALNSKARFQLMRATASTQVWDISDPLAPVKMSGTLTGTQYEFVNDASTLHEYVAFNAGNYLIPEPLEKVNNQDLHGQASAQMIIITHPLLQAQAQRLAQYHQQRDAITSIVVNAGQVFNEFSSGIPDPTALRDYIKMFYDRAGTDTTRRPRYLLLFGDASFDYRDKLGRHGNLVPAYESLNALDPLATYTSDDFFGFLDDGEDINGSGTPLLDVGIGRIPASSEAEATSIVDKVLSYHSPSALGPWRNEFTFVADDEDNNLHLQDAETITASVQATTSLFDIDKIYLDAFRQEAGAGGSRYPDVNNAINSRMFTGNLLWNYSGHGGYKRLAEEVVLDQDIINQFNNTGKLPLFITATCDVAPYDNPLVSSIGENLLLRPKTGAIALMTTTRLVFAFSNRVMNKNYLDIALTRRPDGSYLSLGEAVKLAKNYTYNFSGDLVNNRKFTLLGDPALTIAFPLRQVQTTSVNAKPVGSVPDTLKAMDAYVISGEVTDAAGVVLNNFNGTVYPVVYDKPKQQSTLANDPGSSQVNFSVQNNVIFRGKAQVEAGKFSFRFVVPRDIDYRFGNGRIIYYTDNGVTDGNGVLSNIIVGGTGSGNGDNQGPEIKGYLNDEKFVNGSITNPSPVLIVKLADSSGINILGNGIGHDLVAILDNNESKPFVLNDAYQADVNDFRKGAVRFQLPVLEPGPHTLRIKAWDAMNNSAERILEFRVEQTENLVLDHVLNYPNPFTTQTSFWFEHNHPGEELQVFVQVYTVSGKLVKTLRETIFSTGNRSSEVNWNGRDEYGDRLGRGVYIYRLRVRTANGKSAEKWEKLYIL